MRASPRDAACVGDEIRAAVLDRDSDVSLRASLRLVPSRLRREAVPDAEAADGVSATGETNAAGEALAVLSGANDVRRARLLWWDARGVAMPPDAATANRAAAAAAAASIDEAPVRLRRRARPPCTRICRPIESVLGFFESGG